MEEENTQGQNGQEPETTEEGSPIPDPEDDDDNGDAEDMPEAD
jgi:hypothetical protein